jgi:hypothetical protein
MCDFQFIYVHFLTYMDYIALNVKVTMNDELAHMYVNSTLQSKHQIRKIPIEYMCLCVRVRARAYIFVFISVSE